MTTRADMIETAARALWGDYDTAIPAVQRECKRVATVVLDAVLPQITTVEQLDALPEGTLGIADGTVFRADTPDDASRLRVWTVMDPDTQQWTTSELLLKVDGPLTVVWQPDA
jgi:hypothetical protein